MRIIFFILGILALCVGAFCIIVGVVAPDEYLWFGCIAGSAFAASGITLLIAALKDYRGHWSFVVGLLLISSACVGLGSELDDHRAGKSKKVQSAITLLMFLVTLGSLSLSSAHKLHKFSIPFERPK